MNRLKYLLSITMILAGSNLIAQTINYHGKTSLRNFFAIIRQQTGYNIIASGNQIALHTVISVDATNASLSEVLDTSFKGLPLTYKIAEKNITILPAEKKTTKSPLPKQMVQELLITGLVRDKSGPIQIVTVHNKHNDKVTFTDSEGNFTIERTEFTDTLVFTSIGYERRELVVLPNQQNVSIQLLQTQTVLDEVSILSYGENVSKRLNTGSTSRVSAATIEKTPTADPMLALQNRVPGLLVNAQSGLPGIQTQVQIRGINTVNKNGGAQLPLYVVDGVPFNASSLSYLGADGRSQSSLTESPLKSIDPSNISSIEVLKDADATAIYGARGANGVILITTKRGRMGKPTIHADYYHSFSAIGHFMKMLNTPQYLQMRREAAENDGIEITPDNYPDLLSWSQTANHNWQKEYFGNTAHTNNVELSLTGGTSSWNYLVGGGYRRENTVFSNNGISIGNIRSAVDYTSNDGKFTAGLSANYAADKNDIIPLSFENFQTLPPNYSLFKEDGEMNWAMENPLAKQLQTMENKTKNVITSLNLSYTLLPGLSLKLNSGYTRMQLDQETKNPSKSFNPAEMVLGNATFSTGTNKTLNIEPQLNYNLYRGNHEFRLLLGGTYMDSERETINRTGSFYTDDSLLDDINAAGEIDIVNAQNHYRFLSGFTRLGWTFKERYVVNGTIRRDGSSRFGPGNKYGNFWSLGAAWILSDENWLKENPYGLSFAKLRGSYGLTGNDNIGDYMYFVKYEKTWDNYMGQGYYPTNLFNPNYRWEVNKKLDVAAELGFLKDRIFLEANYYRNRSGNQLIDYGLPSQVGFLSVTQNLDANVQNSGWEFSLRTTNINNLALTWKTNVTFSMNRNKLLDFPNLAGSSYAQVYKEGQPLSLIWGYNLTHVDPLTGEAQYEDVNGDGMISYPDDYTILAPHIPTFFGGLGNTLSYKNFDIDIFFSFKKNPNTQFFPYFSAAQLYNAPVAVLDRWHQTGQQTDFPAYTTDETKMGYYAASQANYVNGSYLRLSNVTLSYRLTEKVAQALKLKNFRAYITGSNLFTITDYPGSDPETGVGMPMLRSFTLGIRSSF